jgi:cytochrome P450
MSEAMRDDFTYDPFSAEVMNNPLPFYKVLRREHPVYYNPDYDGFFFSRFDDIVELLSHADNTFMESEGSLPPHSAIRTPNAGAPPIPPDQPFPIAQRLGMPVYGEVRRAHIAPIMPRGVHELTAFVRDLANARLDVLLPKKHFNLTRDYGGVVSSSVIMHLMGMPLDRAEECLDLVNSGTLPHPETGEIRSSEVAQKAIQTYLPYVEARFAAGADGAVPMVDGMINYRYNGRALTPAEVATQLVCAFIGGTETVPKVTAHGLMELWRHPDQLAAVRADLERNVVTASEEMIRFCAPAQWFMRTAHREVTVAGQTIRPGQRAFFLVGSALRDENEFDDPDSFRWNRPIPRTLAFGHGVHFCIGFHLARMEIRVMVETFLRRVPNFHFDLEAAERPASSFQWGWNTLPVVID